MGFRTPLKKAGNFLWGNVGIGKVRPLGFPMIEAGSRSPVSPLEIEVNLHEWQCEKNHAF